ncbi:binding-protein-dependent transport system inner membrane protein [Hydrogenophaga taeniospiralis CCUG 15921]|uniref:Binding-protein-dependent transport system inner membrane protein n=1 Tax=Hydrogenophaga taeniospiralis CCUG 15921 TaxID=1281780 RepID=A0A9X4NX58_9BURK|nr:ABC transporter permease [Hydrogenophaga taeniospiralis]MDG5978434.1 binding-protein-dependent transport system inner membrane protein [Hydrogenophaga taeniospiralis CCUG 15921]
MRWHRWSRLLLQAVFALLAVGTLCFVMAESLPGDAAYRIAAGRYGYDVVSTEIAQAVRAELGLDRPPVERWAAWVVQVAQGRLGNSMVLGDPVVDLVRHQLGHTVYLSLVAWLMAVALGLTLGLWTALRPAGWLRRAVDGLNTVLRASPSFLLGVLLSTVLAVELDWLPVAGHGELDHVLLPALTLALALCPGFTQVVRDAALRLLGSDAFEFAQVKGLPLAAALWRHALPQTLLATLAYAGVQLVLLVEGMVVVETLFAWPGIGHALVHAVVARDVPMIQGTALAMALLFVLLNGLIDLLLHRLDPRLADAQAARKGGAPQAQENAT